MNDHPNALPAGYRLGEYEIQTVLGSGGFGVTYKAHDHDLDKSVAIKEYLPQDFAVRVGRTTVGPKSNASKDDYAWGLSRFLDEARALARFDHPHINKVHRFIKANGTAYLVLEYVDGDMLSDLLKRKGRFNEADVRRMLDELLDGLATVHKAGYIHRDIKPANIILRRDGSAVLLDFGAARQAIGQRSQMITSILTPGYAPVEQYLNTADAMGAWSDLYSLGVVAYRCLVGGDESVLIDAPSRAHFAKRGEVDKDMPLAVVVGKGEYSDSLLAAIDWAMQVEEGDRPQSVAAMQAALAGESKAVATAPPPKLKPVATPPRKKTTAHQNKLIISTVSVIVGGILLMGVGAVYKNWQAERERVEAQRIADVTEVEQQRIKAEEVERQRAAEAERKRKIAEAIEAEQTKFRRLVGRDASVRRVDSDGATDLHIAAGQNWAKLSQWLIDNGADVNAQLRSDGALMRGATKRRLGVEGDWRRDSDRPLHIAASNNAAEAAKILLNNGADVNARTPDGITPLHGTAYKNAVEAARLLLANDADVNAQISDGSTSLHSTAWLSAVGVAKLLIANGAVVNAQDNDGYTPLDYAIKRERSTMQFLLRQHGGRCNRNCN